MIGDSFAIFQETGAVEFGIRRLTDGVTRRPHLEGLLIPALMVVFSLAGSIFGMAEEVIPFVIIFIPLARRLGYDSIVGTAIPFLGAAGGFAAAFFNPFTVGIAQSIAGVPLYSGLGYRLVTWVIGTAVMIAYVVWYARRVRRDPAISPVRDIDLEREAVEHADTAALAWDARHVVTLGLFVAAMVLLVVGVLKWKWLTSTRLPSCSSAWASCSVLQAVWGRATWHARSSPAPRTWWESSSSSLAREPCW